MRRASGKSIRVASKSVRCRSLLARALEAPGFEGTLSFTLPEALWLSEHGVDDIVVAYPTAHREALRRLAALVDERPDLKISLMIDSTEQLDFIDSIIGRRSQPLRLCIDVDASLWLLGGRVRIGAKRSPVHRPEEGVALARAVAARPGYRLVGLMAYEAQIAGVGDAPPGNPLKGAAVRAMQARSAKEIAARRARVVQAVETIAPLEFVNGGGTGSIETTSSESRVTEVSAGSGLYAPALFSTYRRFSPRPAALFGVSVVRRPDESTATVLGGGYPASGPAEKSRLPIPYLPAGLKLDPMEGAGEVQTPVTGKTAASLRVGDTVFFRHAKAGELCERFNSLFLIEGDAVVDEVPTYRGEGQSFL